MGQRKSDILTFGRKLHDIGRVVVEAVYDAGGNDEDAVRIFEENLRRQIGQLVMGQLKLALKPCEIYAADLIPKDSKGKQWEIIDDVEPTAGLDVAKLKPIPFLKAGESQIGGEELRKRAVGLGCNLGLSDGKRMLTEQKDIPVELRPFYIPLPGTGLRSSDGYLYIAYLYFHGDRWCLYFDRLDDDWIGCGRFARSE